MKPVYFVPTTRRVAALTFDDGPVPGVTDRILGTLDRHGINGTFFMIGSEVLKSRSLARDVAIAGHSVGVHGHSHRKGMKGWTRDALFENFSTGKSVVAAAVGEIPSMVRPPFGNVNEAILSVMSSLGMRYVGWSLNAEDWFSRSWVGNAVRRTVPGTILVLHDGGRIDGDRGMVVAARLGDYIARMRDKGYSFVTVNELMDEWDRSLEQPVGGKRLLGLRMFDEDGVRKVTPMWDAADVLSGVEFYVSAGGQPSPWVISPMSNVEDWIPPIEVDGFGQPSVSVV